MTKTRIFVVRPRYAPRQTYILRGTTLTWERWHSTETLSIPADEAAWITSGHRAKAIFNWHRKRGYPHPMGKDPGELRGRHTGMPAPA